MPRIVALPSDSSPSADDFVPVFDNATNATKKVTIAQITNTGGQASFSTSGTVKQTVYNVRDYGAVGDGVTDDIVALQAAVDACNAAGGGIVYFPHGTYLISDVLYFRGVSGVSTFTITFQGAGVNTVTLKLKNGVGGGTGGHQIRAVVAGYYGQFGNPLTPHVSETSNYFNMFDMTLDFNGANQTVTGNVSYGLLLDNRGQNCVIERCSFINVYATGYNPGTYTYGIGINTYDSRHMTVQDCQFINCDYGTFLTTYAQGDLLDASLYNNRYLNTLYHSIYYESGYSARIIGNRITGAGEAGIYGNVITSTLDTDAVITGNYFDTCVSYGVQMNGNNVVITGNTILNTGYHGISINGQNNTVIGNILTNVGNKASGSTFRRGIMIQGTYHSVSNNTIKTVGEHGIELSGASHNTITGNIILDAGQLSNGSYNGINLENTSTYNVIDNNRINAVASNKIGYGIAEASSADNNNYIGATNNITNMVTSIANIQGASTIALTTPGEVIVNTNANDRGYTLRGATTSISPAFKIQNSSGSTKARIGIAGSAGGMTAGSAAGDLVLRAESQSILITSNGGSSTAMNITSSTDTLADPFNFILGTSTGSKIGTSTSQKLGFYNATPIVQPTGDVVTALSNLGLVGSPTITSTDVMGLSIASGKTLTVNNTITLAGTDSTTMTFPNTSATIARTDAANTFTGHQTIEGVTSTGATGTGALVFATSPAFVTPALGTPASGVATNLTGTAASLTAGNVTTNANLTGDVTSVGNATTLTNAPVIAKVLTGYISGAGTVAATDSILQAIQKLNGNDATNANLTGPITSSGNATSIAAQTGTGTTFVMSASPTLTGTVTTAAINMKTVGTTIGAGSPLTIQRTTPSTDAEGIHFANGVAVDAYLGRLANSDDLVFGTDGGGGFSEKFRVGTDGKLTLADAANIVVGTSTGTKIGTATSQKLGFYNSTPVVQQTQGATLTNNVTSGGSANTLANYTDLTLYTNDSAAIRNNIYQLGQTLKTVVDALRIYGLLS